MLLHASLSLAARFQALHLPYIFLHEIGLASSARARAHHRGRAVVVMDGDGAVAGVMLRTRMVGVEGVITSHRVRVRALVAQAERAARSPS